MRKQIIIIVVVIAFVLQGCSSKKDIDSETEVNTDTTASDDTVASDDTTASVDTAATTSEAAPTEAALSEAAATATPLPLQLVLPVTVNDTGKVLIQTVSASPTYKTNSYIITSSSGESVVVDPTSMPGKDVIDINPAAIVVTHSHFDHNDANFVKAYQDTAQTIISEEGDIQTKDFHIYTVSSSHSGDTINGSNNIIVFEVDGLRIAHMGDIGQNSLTQEQLDAIGKIDIAFMQFENSYSSMTVSNLKGFTLIEQLNPTMIIPTHYTNASRTLLEEKYGTVTVMENRLEMSPEDLPESTLNVFEMTNTHKYK